MGPFSKKMETCQLRDADMKKLVRVLRGISQDASASKEARYRRHTKEDLHGLPRRLRASPFTLHATNLCSMHKGFDDYLINDIWSWLQHEFEGAVGRFLYPIIMSGRLSTTEEFKVRQLEPVSQMWHRNWNVQDTAPTGHEPIHRGDKWAYLQNQCPACILSRIGSDSHVLFALFAGMVGRFNTRTLANAEALGSTDAWEETKSTRIRFVKYWLRRNRDGDALVFAAGTLGMKMKRLRREWREEQQLSPAQPSFDDNSGRILIERKLTDPKIGPAPRPAEVKRYSPASHLGFNISPLPTQSVQRAVPLDSPVLQTVPSHAPTRTMPIRLPSANSVHTIRAAHSSSTEHLRPAPLRPHHPKPIPQPASSPKPPEYAPIWGVDGRPNPPESQYAASVSTLTDNRRQDSVISSLPPWSRQTSSSRTTRPCSMASTCTITSYDGGASFCNRRNSRCGMPLPDPFDNPIYDTLFCDEVDDASTLPKPKPGSMYEAFGDGKWDGARFERVDKEVGDDGEGDEGDGEEENGWIL